MNIQTHCLKNNFYFEDDTLFNFHCSLQTKPFVILYGPSGTGKSKIAQLYADYICEIQGLKTTEHLCFIAVRSNWTSSSDLIGFYDYLNDVFIPSKFYEFLKKAEADSAHPYFVILDEMNLSIVEHYFSDFLACLESRILVSALNNYFVDWKVHVTQQTYTTLSQAAIYAFLDLVSKGHLGLFSEFTFEQIRNHEIIKEWKAAKYTGKEENWTAMFRTEFNNKHQLTGEKERLAGKFFEGVSSGVYKLSKEKKYNFSELSIDIVQKLIENSEKIEQQEFEIFKNKNGIVTMPIPLNLYFVGTINMDESTHPLSSKVLDRANTIEMNNVSKNILFQHTQNGCDLKTDKINSNFSEIKFLPNLNSAKKLHSLRPDLIDILYEVNDGLIQYRTNMGHRSIFEIAHYINLYIDITDITYAEEALDLQLSQRLIPKLAGADERVEESILHTAKILSKNEIDNADAMLNIDTAKLPYPITLNKLQKMYKYYRQNGFVNFANV